MNEKVVKVKRPRGRPRKHPIKTDEVPTNKKPCQRLDFNTSILTNNSSANGSIILTNSKRGGASDIEQDISHISRLEQNLSIRRERLLVKLAGSDFEIKRIPKKHDTLTMLMSNRTRAFNENSCGVEEEEEPYYAEEEENQARTVIEELSDHTYHLNSKLTNDNNDTDKSNYLPCQIIEDSSQEDNQQQQSQNDAPINDSDLVDLLDTPDLNSSQLAGRKPCNSTKLTNFEKKQQLESEQQRIYDMFQQQKDSTAASKISTKSLITRSSGKLIRAVAKISNTTPLFNNDSTLSLFTASNTTTPATPNNTETMISNFAINNSSSIDISKLNPTTSTNIKPKSPPPQLSTLAMMDISTVGSMIDKNTFASTITQETESTVHEKDTAPHKSNTPPENIEHQQDNTVDERADVITTSTTLPRPKEVYVMSIQDLDLDDLKCHFCAKDMKNQLIKLFRDRYLTRTISTSEKRKFIVLENERDYE